MSYQVTSLPALQLRRTTVRLRLTVQQRPTSRRFTLRHLTLQRPTVQCLTLRRLRVRRLTL